MCVCVRVFVHSVFSTHHSIARFLLNGARIVSSEAVSTRRLPFPPHIGTQIGGEGGGAPSIKSVSKPAKVLRRGPCSHSPWTAFACGLFVYTLTLIVYLLCIASVSLAAFCCALNVKINHSIYMGFCTYSVACNRDCERCPVLLSNPASIAFCIGLRGIRGAAIACWQFVVKLRK